MQIKRIEMNIENGCHTTKIRVRYAETDKMGLAYNSHYLTWFEVGRTEFLRDLGFTYDEAEKMGLRLPVIEAGIKYLKPALYDDVLTIKTRFGKKPGLRIRMVYEICREDICLATGFSEHVFTDEYLKPKKPSKGFIKKIQTLWEKASNKKS
ncbi:acyl-CoA thioesterase [Candidatus Latescibacterota bacterium]